MKTGMKPLTRNEMKNIVAGTGNGIVWICYYLGYETDQCYPSDPSGPCGYDTCTQTTTICSNFACK